MLTGLVVIALGVLLLFQQVGLVAVGQTWAVLLLIPALGGLARAARLHRQAGYATPAVQAAATGAAILAFVAIMLLFDLSWSLLWPMFLIIPGAIGLLGATRPDREAC